MLATATLQLFKTWYQRKASSAWFEFEGASIWRSWAGVCCHTTKNGSKSVWCRQMTKKWWVKRQYMRHCQTILVWQCPSLSEEHPNKSQYQGIFSPLWPWSHDLISSVCGFNVVADPYMIRPWSRNECLSDIHSASKANRRNFCIDVRKKNKPAQRHSWTRH